MRSAVVLRSTAKGTGSYSIPIVSKGYGSDNASFSWATPMPADEARHDSASVFRAGVRHHHVANTAFPIGHTKTIKPYRVPVTQSQEHIAGVVRGAYGDLNELMLYTHVPFCPVRCQFCEYTVVDPRLGMLEDTQSTYFKALRREIEMYSEVLGGTKSKRVAGWDIGGGTPSMARSEEIGRLFETVHRLYTLDTDKMEISIETTPRIAAAEPTKLKDYYSMGIRRISMGLQTTDFKQAVELGRDDANAGDDYVQRAMENARAAGFKSFNIDLMYGFPLTKSAMRTGIDPWYKTLLDCVALGPEHITLYRMRYKGTKMAHLQDRVELEQINRQAEIAHETLTSAGYSGMVGKNTYSLIEGNSGCSDYLDRRVREALPYLGFGLGAQSFSHHSLSYNLGAVTKKMTQYLQSVEIGRLPIQDLYHLPKEVAIGKMVSVSFYFGGVDLQAFKHCFGMDLETMFPEAVPFALGHGLMHYTDATGAGPGCARLQLTKIGKRHFGGCVALFYSPAVQEHLMSLPGGQVMEEDPVAALQRAALLHPAPVFQSEEQSRAMNIDTLGGSTPPALDFPFTARTAASQAPMVSFRFVGGGDELQVDAPVGASLLEVAKENGVVLEAACAGECVCSTCHCQVSRDHADAVAPPTNDEEDMLELTLGRDDTSRLACQLRVEQNLQGARVTIPDDMLSRSGLLSRAARAKQSDLDAPSSTVATSIQDTATPTQIGMS